MERDKGEGDCSKRRERKKERRKTERERGEREERKGRGAEK